MRPSSYHIRSMEAFYVCVFFFFKCFRFHAVRLWSSQNTFLNLKNFHLTLYQHGGWGHNDWVFILGCTLPLTHKGNFIFLQMIWLWRALTFLHCFCWYKSVVYLWRKVLSPAGVHLFDLHCLSGFSIPTNLRQYEAPFTAHVTKPPRAKVDMKVLSVWLG